MHIQFFNQATLIDYPFAHFLCIHSCALFFMLPLYADMIMLYIVYFSCHVTFTCPQLLFLETRQLLSTKLVVEKHCRCASWCTMQTVPICIILLQCTGRLLLFFLVFKEKSTQEQSLVFFSLVHCWLSQNVLLVSSQVFKILDFQEAKCHLPQHHEDSFWVEFSFKDHEVTQT